MKQASRRPTLADVARLAGTSTAVVSYVVNGGPRSVSEKTRRRVEQAVDELGYRRNPLAGALSGGHSNLVGLLVPDTANGFFGELSRHIEGEGRRRGLLTLLGNTGYDPLLARDYGRAFAELRPRGIFVTSVADTEGVLDDTSRVYVHSSPSGPHPGSPSVTFDDVNGAIEAVQHLLGHGHSDIHCLSGVRKEGPAGEREEGWRRALSSASIRTERKLHRVPFDRTEAEVMVRGILERPGRPRAVFATTDEQALATIRAASVLGLRIPEDLAVVGFDGVREALSGSVRLTTFALPLDQLAAQAFDTLAATAGPGEAPSVVLTGSLIVGETCGCTPGG